MPRLSRLKVGVDVPWVTSWSEEALLGVQPCASVGGRPAIGQAENPGYGRPLYSRNHLRRQRRSVAEMLCPMCGTPTVHGDRWTQTGRYAAAGALRAKGLGFTLPSSLADDRVVLDAGAISPCHRACAERARDHCPHLQAHAMPELLPFPADWWVAPLMVEARPRAPQNVLAAPSQALPVISFLQLCGITSQRDRGWRKG